jgi:hypothetical protein
MTAQNRLIVNQRNLGTDPCSLTSRGEAGGAAPDYGHIGVSVLMVGDSLWFSPVIDFT